jgi:hypothetical protein
MWRRGSVFDASHSLPTIVFLSVPLWHALSSGKRLLLAKVISISIRINRMAGLSGNIKESVTFQGDASLFDPRDFFPWPQYTSVQRFLENYCFTS